MTAAARLPARAVRSLFAAYRSYPPAIRTLFAGQSLISTGNGALYPFLALYVTDRFHVDIVVAGAVQSIFFLCGALASPVAGWLADRVGRRRVILAALAFDTVFLVALGLAPSLPFVVAAVIGAGSFGTGSYPAIQAVVADIVPEDRRSVVYGAMYQSLGLGWFLGPVLAAPLLGLAGFGAIFGLAAVMLSLAWLVFWRRLGETRDRERHRPLDGLPEPGTLPIASAGEASEYGAIEAGGSSRSATEHGRAPGWLSDRRLLVYVGLHLLTFGAYIQLFNIFPVDGRARLGLRPDVWAAILALNGAMILLGQGFLSALVRRFRKPNVVAGGVLLWSVGFSVLGCATSTAVVLPAVVVLTLGEMLVFPMQPAVVAELSPPDARARYQGVLTMGGSIGNALAPTLGGLAVAHLAGGWWVIQAALLVALSAGYVTFGRRVPSRPA